MAHLCKAANTIFMPIRSGCHRMSNGLSTSADDGPPMADGLCLTQPVVGDPLRSLGCRSWMSDVRATPDACARLRQLVGLVSVRIRWKARQKERPRQRWHRSDVLHHWPCKTADDSCPSIARPIGGSIERSLPGRASGWFRVRSVQQTVNRLYEVTNGCGLPQKYVP
jgi:hypothetical protein